MTYLRSLASVATVFLMQACGNQTALLEDSADPEQPLEACRNELQEGVTLPPGTTVVACGLAPGSELVDVVDGVVYTTSPRGTFFRSELATATRTQLYKAFADERTATYVDGQIYFDGWIPRDDGGMRAGMVAISADVPTPTNAQLVSEAWGYAVGGRVLSDGLVRYVAEAGRQSVLELDVLSGHTHRVVNGSAIGLSPSWLYYCAVGGDVRRIRRDGSEDQFLASASVPAPHCGAEVRAVDEDGIYLTKQDAPYEIWRFGPDGREDFIGAAPEGDAHLPSPPPSRLAVHGPWVYMLHPSALTRLGVDRDTQHVASGTDLGPPLFRDGFIFLALTRDSFDGPIDGVVLRIHEPSLGASM